MKTNVKIGFLAVCFSVLFTTSAMSDPAQLPQSKLMTGEYLVQIIRDLAQQSDAGRWRLAVHLQRRANVFDDGRTA